MIFYICDQSYSIKKDNLCIEGYSLEDIINCGEIFLTKSLIENFFLELDSIELEKKISLWKDKNVNVYGFELGCGLVALDQKQRFFINQNGLINRLMAKYANEVYLKECNIDIRIK